MGIDITGIANPTRPGPITLPAKDWQDLFIEMYSQTMNITKSAFYAGVSRATAQRYMRSDRRFAERCAEAKEEAVDRMEESVRVRAQEGVEQITPIYYQGTYVGDKVRYEFSDPLAKFWLESHRPGVYRTTQRLEHTGVNGGPIEIDVTARRQEILTRAVQRLLDQNYQLKDALNELILHGVKPEFLELINGDDLIFPSVTTITSEPDSLDGSTPSEELVTDGNDLPHGPNGHAPNGSE